MIFILKGTRLASDSGIPQLQRAIVGGTHGECRRCLSGYVHSVYNRRVAHEALKPLARGNVEDTQVVVSRGRYNFIAVICESAVENGILVT